MASKVKGRHIRLNCAFCHLASGKLGQLPLRTVALVVGGKLRALTATFVDALVLLAHGLGGTARAGDGGSVAEVGVDADQV